MSAWCCKPVTTLKVLVTSTERKLTGGQRLQVKSLFFVKRGGLRKGYAPRLHLVPHTGAVTFQCSVAVMLPAVPAFVPEAEVTCMLVLIAWPVWIIRSATSPPPPFAAMQIITLSLHQHAFLCDRPDRYCPNLQLPSPRQEQSLSHTCIKNA